MGNEQSQASGIEIDEKAVEVSDFWTQHNANISNLTNTSNISIFVGDMFLNEPFWSPQTPLEKFSKNLMIYRHPSIIRYISSWQKSCKFYLAVEEVTPLSHIVLHMNTMEICLGLYSILKALCFLHCNASVSHNNVCLASIFVTKEGNWKLGGLEYLCSYKDLTGDFLKRLRSHRYSKGVDINEDKNMKLVSQEKDFIDVFAFCTLAIELLKNKIDGDNPSLMSFKEYCTNIIQEPNILQRPKLTSLLEHDFFKHKFINIHSFLMDLPLKSDVEKIDFFTSLPEELALLNEETVASQLGKLLLSRLVLLNNVARSCLLPYILTCKKGDNGAIFSENTFKSYIAPELLNIFRVRDAQIRLLLLEYFPQFVNCFSKEELKTHILPELLVGIKDTSNELVASTLHTLAEMVPVLGAETVIGGRRAKLFNDGRPKSQSVSRKASKTVKFDSTKLNLISPLSPVEASSTVSLVENHVIINQGELPERPRPDGEEGETSTDEIEQQSLDDDGDNWETWENDAVALNYGNETEAKNCLSTGDSLLELKSSIDTKATKLVDITELDIKNQAKIQMEKSEIDFFEDMEPVIEKSNKFLIGEKDNSNFISTKLNVVISDSNEDGWGDEWE